MILDPVNDQQCLGLLVERARELVRTRLAYDAAARLRSIRNVIAYLQSLPQTDDDGQERIQVIACDVPQRLRFLPPDPNCFERTLAGLVLLELIDPKTERVPVSIDEPERHTGIVERQPGGQWQAVDLFPRRNARGRRSSDGLSMCPVCHRYKPLDLRGRIVTHEYPSGGMCSGGGRRPLWPHGRPTGKRNNTVQDVMGIVHPIGRGVLGIFGLGSVADRLGKLEEKQGWLRPDEPTPAAERHPAQVAPSPAHAPPRRPTALGVRRLQPPASGRGPERDPEMEAAERPAARTEPTGESGGSDHGNDQETATNAPPASWPPAGGGAAAAGRAAPGEAPPKRQRLFLW